MAAIKQARPKSAKLGLEKYGLGLFENTESSFELPYRGGKWRHGLNDQEKEIVETYYGHEFDNPEHKDFWSALPPFFVNHRVRVLDLKNPETILMCGILKEAKVLAPSLEATLEPMANYPFVLTNEYEEQENKATIFEKYHASIAKLLSLKKTKTYLLAVAKYILPQSVAINDENAAYVKLSEFLNGELKTTAAGTKSQAIDIFNRVIDKDKEIVFVTVDFREAVRKNIIRTDNNNYYYNMISQTKYGKNEEECVAFLINPKHQDELGNGTNKDKNYAIRYQLKNK